MTKVNNPCQWLSNIFTGAEKHIGTVAAPITQPPSSFTVVDDEWSWRTVSPSDGGPAVRLVAQVTGKVLFGLRNDRDTSTAKPRLRGSRRLEYLDDVK